MRSRINLSFVVLKGRMDQWVLLIDLFNNCTCTYATCNLGLVSESWRMPRRRCWLWRPSWNQDAMPWKSCIGWPDAEERTIWAIDSYPKIETFTQFSWRATSLSTKGRTKLIYASFYPLHDICESVFVSYCPSNGSEYKERNGFFFYEPPRIHEWGGFLDMN